MLNWNDDGLLESDWVLRTAALKLFLIICLPMMVLIIAGWSLMYTVARRKRKGRTVDTYVSEKETAS